MGRPRRECRIEGAPDESAIWDAYNLLLGGSDTERLRKMMARYELFTKVLELPGDIVEAGVFKGTGLMFWLKLLEIRAPGSIKKVVGFDLFHGWASHVDAAELEVVKAYQQECNFDGTSPNEIMEKVRQADINPRRCELIAGDIGQTALAFVAERPGFRISLLNLDLDLGAPTRATLEALWPRVVPGGIVIFDEYAVDHWSASQGIDSWLSAHRVELKTLTWSRSPTAYIQKP